MTPALADLVVELDLDVEIASDSGSVDLRASHAGTVLAHVSVTRRAGYDAAEAEDAASDALVRELARLMARAEQVRRLRREAC